MLKFFSALLLVSLLGLVAHSFTQADPGLYIFRSPRFVSWQDQMVQFGLWSRTASGIWFVTFLGLGFASYFYLLAHWQKISVCHLTIMTVIICILFLLYFPAGLSHDIFNYIAHAKTLITYHQNPLLVAPNALAGDPILPYVHWLASPSRYGPVWIVFSGLAFFLGQSSLLLTFLAFKAMYLLIYGAIGVLLSKTVDHLKLNKRKVFVSWLLNPFVVIEFLFSSHTDALVGVFLLLTILFALTRKFSQSWLAYLASAGVKIVSLPFLLPIFLKEFFYLKTEMFLKVSVLTGYLASAIITFQWSINPWYFSIPILLSTLVIENKFYRYLALSLSVASELRYIPYFFMGYFDPSIKIRMQLFLLGLIPFCAWLLWGFMKELKIKGVRFSSIGQFMGRLELV